jgi:hypothetical protein
MRTRRIIALCVALALGPIVAGPAHAAETGHPRAGRLVSAAPLAADIRLAGASRAWHVAYRSTSWNGGLTVTTGTVTVPRGRPPSGGWPVVSFGHGFGGTADACAPSHTGPSPWERALQEALLGECRSDAQPPRGIEPEIVMWSAWKLHCSRLP